MFIAVAGGVGIVKAVAHRCVVATTLLPNEQLALVSDLVKTLSKESNMLYLAKNKGHLGRWQAYKIINDAAKAVGLKKE